MPPEDYPNHWAIVDADSIDQQKAKRELQKEKIPRQFFLGIRA
jgi:hypothetical protein